MPRSTTKLKLAKITGKFAGNFSKHLKLGHGSVLPGRVGLMIEPDLVRQARKLMRHGCILVTGTNGKSTTAYYIAQVLTALGKSVCTNSSGANMLSGIAAACLTMSGPVDYGVFEVDEAWMPKVVDVLDPTMVVVLNFSRDQMDRYAELESLVLRIDSALAISQAQVIYNHANPYAALAGRGQKITFSYFVEAKEQVKLLDKPVCTACERTLLDYVYQKGESYLSCSHCGIVGASSNMKTRYANGLLYLPSVVIGCGTHELAETLTATLLVCQRLGISGAHVLRVLQQLPPKPVHRLLVNNPSRNSVVELLLAKNPESLNRVLASHRDGPIQNLALVVNDKLVDGKDTSWLWDVDFETLLPEASTMYVSGTAQEDVMLRLLVAGKRDVIRLSSEDIVKQSRHWSGYTLIIANYTAYSDLANKLQSGQTVSSPVTPSVQLELQSI